MKVDFYVDVYPGARPENLCPTVNPFQKHKGVKRFKITAHIPDSAFFGVVDAVAPVESVSEVDKDYDEGLENG